jgi:hypothetical protein
LQSAQLVMVMANCLRSRELPVADAQRRATFVP